VVDINYDPFSDILGTSTIVDWRTLRSPVSELFTVRCRTVFTTNAMSGLCHIRYRVFPGKTPAFVATLQWVANPALNLYIYRVPYNLFTRVLRFQNDQFRTQIVVYISFRRRSVSDPTSQN
jgi:hypothetical protein